MSRVQCQLAVLAAALFATATLDAQALRGVPQKPRAGATWDAAVRDLSRVVVKFAEGPAVRLRAGRLVGDPRLAQVGVLLAEQRGITRLFDRPVAALDAERAALLAGLEADFDPPADLNNYYVIDTGDVDRGQTLLRALNALAVVEIAYPEWHAETPPPGDILPVTPLFQSRQGYHAPAPAGVDHGTARVIPGARGDGLIVIDVEYAWHLDHEDVPTMVQQNVTGSMATRWHDHGSAVVGELAAEWDRYGVTGLVDLCTVRMHSHLGAHTGAPIDAAAAHVAPGAFILLEMQISTPLGLGPVEYRQDVFDAIRNAVLAGKHVFEAAGNGSVDLDSPQLGGLFDRSVRDSGAVIVGATNGPTRTRANFSTYGSRVDAAAWGGSVTTTGYGYLFQAGGDPRQDYTATFSGTSSATPIVLGAAMALVGAVRDQLGLTLPPPVVRTLLQQNGTELPGQRIGVQPDLQKLLAAVGLPRGLHLVDGSVGETMTVTLDAPPTAPFMIAAALGQGLVDLGPAGRWLLDNMALVALAGTMPATGTATFAMGLPNDEALRGHSLFLQGVWVDARGTWLTNSVENYVW